MPDERPSVLVIGATGTVGGALCGLLSDDGYQVHAVGRDREALQRLADRTGAQAHRADLTDLSSALDAARELRDSGIDLAIAAVGGWYVEERGLELPMARWDSTIASNLTAHFVAARAFGQVLDGSSPVYLALNGIASHQPCEGSIAICVAGAGQSMMLDVLAAEGRGERPSYAELVVDTPILLPGQTHEKDEPTHSLSQVYSAIRDLAAQEHRPGEVTRRHVG